MGFFRTATFVAGIGIAGLLGTHRIGDGMDKAFQKIPIVEIGTPVMYKSFSDYVQKSDPKPVNFIAEADLEKIIDSSSQEVRLPDFISQQYVMKKIGNESSDDAYAISIHDARGLMQLKEDAWEQVDTSDYESNWFKPLENINAGRKYLRYLYYFVKDNFPKSDEYPEGFDDLNDTLKLDIISAAYNIGPTKLMDAGWDIASNGDAVKYVRKMHIAMYDDSSYGRPKLLSDAIGDSLNPDFPIKHLVFSDTSRADTALAYGPHDGLKTR